MKQETIDLIKSMTEQGFLVIVDPEKLKGEYRAIIKVMARKDTDNKAEVTLTAEKPGIDLLQCDGRRFRAKIDGVECEGKIRVDYDIDYGIYLCNDKKDNAWRAVDKFEYRCAWFMRTDRSDFNTSITDFELLPEPKVIFTNCVGEVFTEEDIASRLKVWWADTGLDSGIIETNCMEISGLCGDELEGEDNVTDIFRSKKSLLKYLYETC